MEPITKAKRLEMIEAFKELIPHVNFVTPNFETWRIGDRIICEVTSGTDHASHPLIHVTVVRFDENGTPHEDYEASRAFGDYLTALAYCAEIGATQQ